ncbi:MAG: T9SS type A sorting domain-containing protein [Bacteroidota bacterium]
MRKVFMVLFIVGMCMFTVNMLYGQAFHLKVYTTDGVGLDSLILGNAVGATEGIDTLLGEIELPPPPYPGIFDVRSQDWGSHTERGTGTKVDYRPYRRLIQTDTFQISYQLDSANTLGGKLRVSWSSGLASMGGGYWHLLDVGGGRRYDIDMTTLTTYDVSGPPNMFYIIYGDSTRYQTVSYFRVAYDHDAKMALGKATKPEAKLKPTERPNIHAIAIQLDKADPLTEIGGFGLPGKGAGPYKAGVDSTVRRIVLKKYGDILKSLFIAKTQTMHTWLRSCLDSTDAKKKGKIVKKVQYDSIRAYIGKKALTSNLPVKGFQNNALFAEVIVARLNVALNDANRGTRPLVTGHPSGPNFGALTVNAPDPTHPLHPWDGKTVMDVIADADTVLSCGVPPFPAEPGMATLSEYRTAMKMINESFIKTYPDTASFSTTFAVFDTTPGTRWNGKWLTGMDKVYRITGVPMPTCGYLIRGPQPAVAAGSSVPHAVANAQPKQYTLDQNYPNPFNPTTTISFSLANEGFVTVKIFNMLGQEVATLANHEEMAIGSNEVEFNASNFASGVYFYRIAVNDAAGALKFQAVKKMMLVK